MKLWTRTTLTTLIANRNSKRASGTQRFLHLRQCETGGGTHMLHILDRRVDPRMPSGPMDRRNIKYILDNRSHSVIQVSRYQSHTHSHRRSHHPCRVTRRVTLQGWWERRVVLSPLSWMSSKVLSPSFVSSSLLSRELMDECQQVLLRSQADGPGYDKTKRAIFFFENLFYKVDTWFSPF